MKLLLILAVVVAFAPFIILWNAGRYGPALSLFLLAGLLAFAGFELSPGVETWPGDSSGLEQVSGKVDNITRVTRGGNFWYEIALDGHPKSLYVRRYVAESDMRNIIGESIEAGCQAETPQDRCWTVSLRSGGRTLVDYQPALEEHLRFAEAWRERSRWALMAAGAAALIGLGIIISLLVSRQG